ncbi:hypothetical protein [Desulfosporosinus sp.]|nr:hypothetical protein [Desulfosporosinus sp.]
MDRVLQQHVMDLAANQAGEKEFILCNKAMLKEKNRLMLLKTR